MLEILKILRRASQDNCLNIVHTLIAQLVQDYMGTSPKGPNIQDLQESFKGLSGDQSKIYGL